MGTQPVNPGVRKRKKEREQKKQPDGIAGFR